MSYGHIGASDALAMLRIPVYMHNVPGEDRSSAPRPGTPSAPPILEGADFRACQAYGPLYGAAAFTSKDSAVTRSRASAKIAAKSSCSGLTRIRPPCSRDRHNAEISWAARRTSNARFTRNRAKARCRFCSWLRRSLASAVTPVGSWTRRIAVSTLFRCCPPGPLRRSRSTRHWR
jgi:hypothetical protein